jgi:hypothetical protein
MRARTENSLSQLGTDDDNGVVQMMVGAIKLRLRLARIPLPHKELKVPRPK